MFVLFGIIFSKSGPLIYETFSLFCSLDHEPYQSVRIHQREAHQPIAVVDRIDCQVENKLCLLSFLPFLIFLSLRVLVHSVVLPLKNLDQWQYFRFVTNPLKLVWPLGSLEL